MSADNKTILAGTQLVETGTSRTSGACATYKSDGTIDQATPRASSGLGGGTYAIPLTSFKNDDGSSLAAAAASGKFGVSNTTGTSLALLSEAASNNAKTDTAGCEVLIPQFYKAASDISVVVNAGYTVSSGSVATHTVAGSLYRIAADGTEGSDLIGTTSTLSTTAATSYTLTATGTTLNPGDRAWLKLVGVVGGTGGGTLNINSVVLQ